jgi:hypothetical protein
MPISVNAVVAEYRLDSSSDWLPCMALDGAFNSTDEAYSCNPTGLSEGEHTISVRASNQAAHRSPAQSDSVTTDATPPTNPTSLDTPCSAFNDVWQNTCSDPAFTWNGAADDTSGISGYHLYWGTDPAGESPYIATSERSYAAPAIEEGAYYLRIQTKDRVGNWSDWSTLFTMKYDVTPPTASITPPETIPAEGALVEWSGSDALSGIASYDIQYHLANETDWVDWLTGVSEPSAIISPTLPGRSESLPPKSVIFFRVRATDQAGNTGEYSLENRLTSIPGSALYLPLSIR